jgi:type II secretory ATPase GspE/PulE/Tfp pilus assembly ATPase PilB-like protein
LKEAGMIDDFQLEAALSHQRNWGGKLGSILVELEFAREEDIAKIVAEKLNIPYVNLFEPELSAEILRTLKGDMAKKFGVIPVRKESTALVLAMSDPMDIETMDNIRFITGLTIRPVLAMASEIKDAIRKYYDGEPVSRSERFSAKDSVQSPAKMEIVRDIPEFVPSDWNQQTKQPVEVKRPAESSNQKMVLDALITLLIEKDFITREELAKYVEQKKMGI